MPIDNSKPVSLIPLAAGLIPEALHIGTNDRPYADDFGAPGVALQLLHADVEAGTFAVHIRFQPSGQIRYGIPA